MPSMPSMPPVLGRVPLTIGQKLGLAVDCVPLLTFSALAAIYVTMLRPVVGAPALPSFLVMAAVLLLNGLTTLRRARDIVSGVAVVREDVLERFGRSGHRRRSSFGSFATLGRLWMSARVLLPGRKGHRHRITYSPASRIVWNIEPLD
jgi:hypothetical protein